MHIKTLQSLFMAMILVIAATSVSQAEEVLSADQKTEIENMIGSYLRDNPEVIIESLESFRTRQEQELQAQASKTISQKMEYLASADAPSAGNPDGDIVVIEFFDYNCGYCKRALPDLQEALKKDENLRIVFREMPILSPASHLAAQWALAAHEQGKYFEYHSALMTRPGQKDESGLEKIAEDLGLDVKKMKQDAKSSKIAKALEQDLAMARSIGIRGTPAFIVNGELYRGYLGKEGLQEAIKDARQK